MARLLLRRQHRRRRRRQPARRLLPAARVRHRRSRRSSPSRSTSLVAVVGLAIAKATPYKRVDSMAARAGRRPARPARRVVYVAIALSGMTALAAEVIWTRLLSLLFGATTYTFSLILAVFLVRPRHRQQRRIGDGPRARAARGSRSAWCQLLLCAAIAWTAYVLTQSLPYWPINPSIVDRSVVQAAARLRARAVGRAAGGDSVGRELPAGAGVGRGARPGSGAAGRRRLRRQHGRRDRRRARRQPAARRLDRQPARAAGADRRRRHRRRDPGARPAVVASADEQGVVADADGLRGDHASARCSCGACSRCRPC